MKAACMIGVLIASVSVAAQSDDAIQKAVADGLKGKNKHQGLILRDSGQSWAAAMTASSTTTASQGFWLEAFTPLSWVAQQAASAAKEYRSMSAADVGPELREEVFRVVAHPDMPNTVAAGGLTGTASVKHVVLRDEKRKIVIQPQWKEPFAETAKNAMGAAVEFTGLNLKFSMAELKEIRGANGDKEFFITIIGSTGEEKDFKVKKKHFDELR